MWLLPRVISGVVWPQSCTLGAADAQRAWMGAPGASVMGQVARATVKAQRKVGDLDAVAALSQLRAPGWRCWAQYHWWADAQVFQLDHRGCPRPGLQRGVEHRVAIKARQAAPHHAGVVVDEVR